MTTHTYNLWEALSDGEIEMLLATGGIPCWAPFVIHRRAMIILRRVCDTADKLLAKELKRLRSELLSARKPPAGSAVAG